jgi:hypothetical protein
MFAQGLITDFSPDGLCFFDFMAQMVYTHVSKCKNDKIKLKEFSYNLLGIFEVKMKNNIPDFLSFLSCMYPLHSYENVSDVTATLI